MTYRVEIANRAIRDIQRIRARVKASGSRHAILWIDELERHILSLDENPARCSTTPENETMRQLFFGRGHNIYRIIFAIDESARVVTVIHIRHDTRVALDPKSRD